jgi:hypothetical protein
MQIANRLTGHQRRGTNSDDNVSHDPLIWVK